MRQFINIVTQQPLYEARKKAPADPARATDTAVRPKFDLMPDLDAGNRQMAATGARGGRPPADGGLPGKRATGNQTRRAAAAAGAGMMRHPGAGEAMRGLMNHGVADDISDADAARNAGHDPGDDIGVNRPVPNNENLPAIINRDIALTGGRVEPEWHQIKHLPGYMLNAIRAGGRAVFREFTDTPIEDIQMIGTIGNLNPESDVRAVMNWIRHNGVQEQESEMTFGGGVKADVAAVEDRRFSFLLVKDHGGMYVYGWTGGRGTKVAGDQRPRLTRG